MLVPLKVKIKKLSPDAVLPRYAHGPDCDAGMDLHALDETTIQPGQRRLIRTGISVELIPGIEAQIRSRSGLALKHGVAVLNAPGTIDPSYRNDVGVILINLGQFPFEIRRGDRIAQMVIARYEPVEWDEQSDLAESMRGQNGFGSTGV